MAITLHAGRGGLDALALAAQDGARAELYLHGAHVASWTPAGAGEQLFVSTRSAFDGRRAIRGGVPVIFPQFGPGPLPRHGLARTSRWEVAEHGRLASGAAHATLRFRDSAETRRVWPAHFEAELSVALAGRSLAASLAVANPGPDPLSFTGALHTYVAVGDIASTSIDGLTGVRYRDQAAGGAEAVDAAPTLVFEGEVDRLYVDAPRELRLRDGGGSGARTLALEAEGFPDTVVWNPWADKARELDDLGDDEYRQFVCIEAAAAARPVLVAPGERWTGVQRLRLL